MCRDKWQAFGKGEWEYQLALKQGGVHWNGGMSYDIEELCRQCGNIFN